MKKHQERSYKFAKYTSFASLSAGLLVTAVSFVLYVKEHNKLLKKERQKQPSV